MREDEPRVWAVVLRALRLQCPNCGSRGLFATWFRLAPRCPVCAFNPASADAGYMMGALTINTVVSEVLALGVVLLVMFFTWPDPPWALVKYGGIALAIVLPFAFYPFTKSLFIALNYVVGVDGESAPR